MSARVVVKSPATIAHDIRHRRSLVVVFCIGES